MTCFQKTWRVPVSFVQNSREATSVRTSSWLRPSASAAVCRKSRAVARGDCACCGCGLVYVAGGGAARLRLLWLREAAPGGQIDRARRAGDAIEADGQFAACGAQPLEGGPHVRRGGSRRAPVAHVEVGQHAVFRCGGLLREEPLLERADEQKRAGQTNACSCDHVGLSGKRG
jgi:hypothetical protein